jgi:hypothetical protein
MQQHLMMKHSTTITYELKWELRDSPHYKFTADGKCVNTRTGRVIKKALNGYTVGYHIGGKFVSASALRPRLQKIERVTCPF